MRETTPYFRRLADCVGKEPFASPQVANKVLRRRPVRPRGKASKTRKVSVEKSRVYRCPQCGHFHIGTKPKSLHAPRQRDQAEDGGRENMDYPGQSRPSRSNPWRV